MPELVQSEAFEPQWAVPPGDTVAALLAANAISRETFAETLGASVETVQRLLLGLEAIDAPLAKKLSSCFGTSQKFWLNRESQFRADTKRLKASQDTAEREAWAKQFPLKDMVGLGWINIYRNLSEAADECLHLFGVPDVTSWKARYGGQHSMAAFRISNASKQDPAAITAWLRWAELVADRTPCAAWNPETFQQTLDAARRLTWQKSPASFLPKLRALCARAGVAVVVARTPKGCPASGATRFLSHNKAMIVLSFRYRSDDQFWFTFFHEAGHLLLHGNDCVFLEDVGDTTSVEEAEANAFSASVLIPADRRADLAAMPVNKEGVLRFAQSVGIAPGIVVGQLQHMGRIRPENLNWLKRRYEWEDIQGDRLIP